jgi:hypothetical protein
MYVFLFTLHPGRNIQGVSKKVGLANSSLFVLLLLGS